MIERRRVSAPELGISACFAIAQGHLSWREAKWGVESGLIPPQTFIDLACEQLGSKNLADDPLLNELCALLPADQLLIDKLVEAMCGREPDCPEEVRRKWLYLSLKWAAQNWRSYRNFPGVLEEVVVFFDYPDELHELNRAAAGMSGHKREAGRDCSAVDKNFLALVESYL